IMSWNEIADGRVGLLPTLLSGPFAERKSSLPLGERYARDIGRDARNSNAGRISDDEWNLGLGRQWCNRRSDRRTHHAEQNLHLIARDEFLRDSLANLGVGAVVAFDDLDANAGWQVLHMLLGIEIHALLHFIAGSRKEAG